MKYEAKDWYDEASPETLYTVKHGTADAIEHWIREKRNVANSFNHRCQVSLEMLSCTE